MAAKPELVAARTARWDAQTRVFDLEDDLENARVALAHANDALKVTLFKLSLTEENEVERRALQHELAYLQRTT